ncbi:hypothetical protein GOP47_0013923 [Adiantum capillus-veneris]|uniref:DOMON domain-containing protein n=1 Tax=Adiantum capillus-veneris TaxID=13818 RepID=A0A9D4UPX6_ADICA|nr:hypothetical protein GOP47_0013923 [Adiantum capillus-veneris]
MMLQVGLLYYIHLGLRYGYWRYNFFYYFYVEKNSYVACIHLVEACLRVARYQRESLTDAPLVVAFSAIRSLNTNWSIGENTSGLEVSITVSLNVTWFNNYVELGFILFDAVSGTDI